MRTGDNACARATTFAPVRRRVVCGRGVFSQTQRSCDGVCGRVTMPASGRRRTCALGRQRLRPCNDGCHAGGVFFHQHSKLQRSGDDVCVRATTSACARATARAPVRRRVPRGRGVFHKHPKLQRSGDDVCVRATTLAHGRQRPRLRDDVWILFGIFFAFAIQTKLFHYPFSRITQIVLKIVIQSHFY